MSKIDEYCKKHNYRPIDYEYLFMYRAGVFLLPLAVAAWIAFLIWGDKILGMGNACNFLTATGFYCPGCGGTRAMYWLARFHILKSLKYNIIVAAGYGMYFFFILNTFLIRHGKRGIIKKCNPFVLLSTEAVLALIQFAVRIVLSAGFGIFYLD